MWAGHLAIAPHRKWGVGARVLVNLLGLGVPGWGVGLGVDLGPVVYLLGTGSAPTKTPCEKGRSRPWK